MCGCITHLINYETGTGFGKFICVFCVCLTSSPAKITTGRIIAVLKYSYQLCKHLASQNVAAARLASFVSTVATWLFKSFIEAKLYNWLRDVGGWVGHVSCTV